MLLSCVDMSEVGSYVPCSHLRDAAFGEVRSWWITCVTSIDFNLYLFI